ncbi:hypothetical protein WJX72_005641 [[Myrmecia] bisecta]|uniref:BACK domain-containing protein n=1 Tax=[Myrmecia] bisecta TaxID=41462 RepID=A0AAW1PVW0_9CHLO
MIRASSSKKKKKGDAYDGSSHKAPPEQAYELHVSRLAVAAASEVFRRKVQAWKPAPGEPLVIEILPGEEELFRLPIKFIYNEELDASIASDDAEVLRMLLLANYYAMDECATRGAARLLETQDLSLAMASRIVDVASEQAHCETLVAHAHICTLRHIGAWDNILNSSPRMQLFRDLPYGSIQRLVADDTLFVMSENTVFSLVIAWMRHNKAPASQLGMLHIRYAHVTAAHLRGIVAEDELFKGQPDHATILIDALAYRAIDRQLVADMFGKHPQGIYARWQFLEMQLISSQTHHIQVSLQELAAMVDNVKGQFWHSEKLSDDIWLGGYVWRLFVEKVNNDTLGLYVTYAVKHGHDASYVAPRLAPTGGHILEVEVANVARQ